MAKNPGCIVSHLLDLQVLVSLPQVQLPHMQQALDLTQTGYNLAGHWCILLHFNFIVFIVRLVYEDFFLGYVIPMFYST